MSTSNPSVAARHAIRGATIDRRANDMSRERIMQRVRGEFLEMPGLRMTIPQASRLFDVRADICRRVLDRLVCEGTLRHGEDQRYGICPP